MKDKFYPKDYPYPNASYMLNAKNFLSDKKMMLLSCTEIGKLFRKIDFAVVNGDWEYLRQFTFIERVFKGTSKRVSLPPSLKKQVLSSGKCAYCGATEKLTVDHIIPYSKVKKHELKNLQCLCAKCNRAKFTYPENDYLRSIQNV